MKFLIVGLLLAGCACTEISDRRQISLEAVEKLRATIPHYQTAQDYAVKSMSEAKRNASVILSNFYHIVFETKITALVNILEEEASTMNYAKSVDEWCWESNVPLLEGTMGWVGNDFSECARQLDGLIAEVVASTYNQFHADEAEIKKISLLDVLQRRNIISNPKSIIDAIENLEIDIERTVPELGDLLSNFETELNDKIPGYSGCLKNSVQQRTRQIEFLKGETIKCLAEQKKQKSLH
ncbi:uncharacterized protein LOC129777727 [Toxorhynchites rutilus septentrionalis]|uniref:uncharacterized protein LOC129777727 n=1 Tax=Toxorhynchites rutilus septentrionalis TaxID=329112 RepID=UPI0024793295|nr:uncharacterized protein LOC129777727 [Toxorhynchites rutilus septentrionalis]